MMNAQYRSTEKDRDLQELEECLGHRHIVKKIALGIGIVLVCLLIGFLILLGFSSLIPTTLP